MSALVREREIKRELEHEARMREEAEREYAAEHGLTTEALRRVQLRAQRKCWIADALGVEPDLSEFEHEVWYFTMQMDDDGWSSNGEVE